MIYNMYNPCNACQTPGQDLRLVEDVKGDVSPRSAPGTIWLVCPKCAVITLPNEWNTVNKQKEPTT